MARVKRAIKDLSMEIVVVVGAGLLYVSIAHACCL